MCIEDQQESQRLEAEAVELYRDNKFFLSMKPRVKKFFSDVAELNQWKNLKKELK